MTTDARMIGVNQSGNDATSIELDIGWVRTMEEQGFATRTADVGGPLLSTVTVLSYVEAARINELFSAQAANEQASDYDLTESPDDDDLREMVEELIAMENNCAKSVEQLLEKIGGTHYFSAWVIVETANID